MQDQFFCSRTSLFETLENPIKQSGVRILFFGFIFMLFHLTACHLKLDVSSRDSAVIPSTQSSVEPPTASILGAPSGRSNSTGLNLSVAGTGVVNYRYKVTSGSNECSSPLAYSAKLSVVLNITDLIAGLPDGVIYVCVIGSDAEGREQSYAMATVANWTKDTLAPTAISSGAPTGVSFESTLLVSVGGAEVVSYRYKVGETTSVDCTSPNEYSDEIVETTDIIHDLSAFSDGSITLCVIGKDSADNWQSFATATSSSWVKNSLSLTYDPNVMSKLLGLPMSLDPVNTLNVTIAGTDITHYRYKVGVATSVNCSLLGGYSEEIDVSTLITDDLSTHSDGTELKICVIGSKGGNNTNYQPLSSAPSYRWTKDNLVVANISYLGESYSDTAAAMDFSVTIPSPKPYPVTFDYQWFGDATSGTDHDLGNGQVTIPPGQTSASVSYNLLRNLAVNAEKTFNLQLSQSSKVGVALGPLAYQFNSIKNTDGGGSADVVSVSAGARHTCAVNSVGELRCWGDNLYNQLGDGTSNDRATPVLIDSGTSYLQVAAGGQHTCAITSAGVLKCWGANANGQLGDGSTTSRDTPVIVDSGTFYTEVTSGRVHSCGITSTGVLKCWGSNGSGRLGDGSGTQRLEPVVVDSGTEYLRISAGYEHTCGITSEGVLKCWGENLYSRLGDGTTLSQSSPVVIDSGISYMQIGLGHDHTCGITSAGVLKCWGYSPKGLGDGIDLFPRTTPSPIDVGTSYTKVVGGEGYSCGITSTGTLKCWGENVEGQLGDGTRQDYTTPTLSDAGTAYTQVAARGSHACGVTGGGALKCWGYNGKGQLGDGTTTDRPIPVIVDSGTAYTQVASGVYHGCGITSTGVIKYWGTNSDGQLGDGTTNNRSTPVPIDAGTSYVEVSVGDYFTCGITTDGALKCWGNNERGQVGGGTHPPAWLPHPILGLRSL